MSTEPEDDVIDPKDNLNNKAWKELFARHNILSEIEQKGVYRISAKTINKTGRQARLMTYSHKKTDLPKILRDNKLGIVSDSRGNYIIGRFKLYQDINDNPALDVFDADFRSDIETIDPTNIYSEAAGILCAYNTGILNNLAGEKVDFTVGGRMSSGSFDYSVDAGANTIEQISVANAQIEIDGGFEGASKFLIIEAKNYGAEDFNIRQLYYPYRLWREKTSKEVVPVFMTLSNDVFSFYTYRFRDAQIYNSIELVEQRKYRIAPVEIGLADILAVYEKARKMPPSAVPGVPFPQADVFPRIVDLLGSLQAYTFITQKQVATNYVFTGRQAHYYPTAGIYLGLIKRNINKDLGVFYTLTENGSRIMRMPTSQKFLALAEEILRNPVFSRTFDKYIKDVNPPTKADVCKIMVDENIPLNEETTDRRARTVIGWVNWILELKNQ